LNKKKEARNKAVARAARVNNRRFITGFSSLFRNPGQIQADFLIN
jgi:hypothetical protein